ncbi:hypothetical protein [Enterobacter kobei]|uniref:hypothetical protein n=1 Tax=Enterobacter kobei TaxID=208224 RepID=UPI00244C64FC|nr:hypothetical protein [Enterobacter kobei]MDH1371987.1 hypothetical protein [Enterobacter kobei]MDH1990445.1 hypothetical protein [Enterobacter kobei]MDH2008317.1 hypothetical protein [Enterobacter kobei]
MGWKRGNSPSDMKKFINDNSPKIGDQFKKELSERMRTVTKQIQQQINVESKGGVVAYTNRATKFNFYKPNGFTSINQIIVMPDQADYLKNVIDPNYARKQEYKVIPYQNARLTKQGNISQLKNKDKYKRVKSKNGKEFLIDTSKNSSKRDPAMARKKRVVGYYGSVGRKPLFDFYDETEKKVIKQLRTLRGTFNYRWR